MKVDFEKQIESLPKKKNSFKEKLFNQSYFLRSSEFSSSTINKEEIVFDSKKSNIGLLLMVGLPCVFISLKFISYKKSEFNRRTSPALRLKEFFFR